MRDDRLRLIFTCCHPALAPSAQVALTLRLLGGLTTAGDRAGVPRPRADDGPAARAREGQDPRRRDPVPRPERRRAARAGSRAVLAVIYLIFNEGYTRELGRATGARRPVRGGDPPRPAAGRAHARRAGGAGAARADAARSSRAGAARTTPDGDLVLLRRPGPQPLGPRPDRRRARRSCGAACAATSPGPYQIQAAINAVHSDAPTAAATDWRQILAALRPAARDRAEPDRRPQPRRRGRRGRRARRRRSHSSTTLDLDSYYLFHAIRADLLRRLGRAEQAEAAYRAAIERTENTAEIAFMDEQIAAIGRP